jgi:ribosomal protein S6--L-glutamate ligase
MDATVTRIGIISAYPDEDWEAQRIFEAARARGAVEVWQPSDFSVDVGGARPIVTVRGEDVARVDLVLTPRAIGDQGDAEFQIELYQLVGRMVPVVNPVGALVTAIDKFKTSWLLAEAHLPTPRVWVVQRLDEACRALFALGRAVVKPLYGSLGIGVELLSVENGRPDDARLRELLERRGALYLQAYVPDACDVRAFVIGERVEAAIVRRAAQGEFRANLSQGAEPEEIALDPVSSLTAVRAAQVIGLKYAGVDLLLTRHGPVVLEVNGTPAFRGVNAATGRDMAQAIVDHALDVARPHASRVQGRPRALRRERG